MNNTRINEIELSLTDERKKLTNHKLYNSLDCISDIQLFMESHVFAVWDFMSLLKSLQAQLTTLSTPWVPSENPTLSRFINEIVFGEESDLNELGEPKSHFTMYLDAMNQIGANTAPIELFIKSIISGRSVQDAMSEVTNESSVLNFVNYTFDVIKRNKPHEIAAAFTFGREDLIPDMFIEIVNKAEENNQHASYNKLTYYLHRHIEIDGDEHGPLSLQMVAELCGDDTVKWQEAAVVAKDALNHRILLWDGIADKIANQKLVSTTE